MSTHRISPALRQRVGDRARWRCSYCLTAQAVIGPLLEVDHILPEARGGTATEENLTLGCPMCNAHKAARVDAEDPESRMRVALFHPNRACWREHFEWIEGGTIIQGRTPTGRATVQALCMNHPEMVATRRLWVLAGWHPPND